MGRLQEKPTRGSVVTQTGVVAVNVGRSGQIQYAIWMQNLRTSWLCSVSRKMSRTTLQLLIWTIVKANTVTCYGKDQERSVLFWVGQGEIFHVLAYESAISRGKFVLLELLLRTGLLPRRLSLFLLGSKICKSHLDLVDYFNLKPGKLGRKAAS